MTSALYRRYIPPSQQASLDGPEQSVFSKSSRKKRKRVETRDILPETGVGSHHLDEAFKHTAQDDSVTTHDHISEEPVTEHPLYAASELEERPRKKTKIKKRRHREDVSTASPLVESKDRLRHSGLETHGAGAGQESSTGREDQQSSGAQAPEADLHEDGITDTKHRSIQSKLQRSHKLANATRTEAEAEPKLGVNEAETDIELHDLVPLPQPDSVPNPEPTPSLSALPPWLAKPIRVSTSDSRPLEDLKLSPKVLSVLQNKGYRNAFAVQTAVLPLLLPGPEQQVGDVCISAATGSGKTLAYMLPLTESLRRRTVVKLRAVLVVPTRELVTQAWEVCELCATGSGLKIGTAVGNKSLKEEQELLVKKTQRYLNQNGVRQKDLFTGSEDSFDCESDPYNLENISKTLPRHIVDYESKVDILICTPGRLVEHMRRTKGFTLHHVQWLIIDEADRLLNESFQEWVGTVMKALESKSASGQLDIRQELLSAMGFPQEHRSIRKVILSATMTKDVGSLSALKLYRPQLIVVESAAPELANDVASTADLADGAEKPNVKESSDGYDLPPTLHEKAVGVGDGGDKPLYLLELLKSQVNVCDNLRSKQSSHPPERGSRASWPDVTAVAADGGLPLANQGRVGLPASLEVAQRSTSSSSSGSSDTSCSSSPHIDTASRDENPTYPSQGVLIFTNNNENALRLARLMSILHPPYRAAIRSLTKSTSTSAGRQVLAAFRAGKVSILIASDRASRGLDLPNLRCVINYDIPTSVTSYVHRVGRTARAGKDGSAWTLTAHNEARWFWNEIVRGHQIRRAPQSRVERVKINVEGLGDEAKTAYAEALKMLGEEVKGHVHHTLR